jgi:hypothetical protein
MCGGDGVLTKLAEAIRPNQFAARIVEIQSTPAACSIIQRFPDGFEIGETARQIIRCGRGSKIVALYVRHDHAFTFLMH